MARHCARIPWPRYDRNSRLCVLPGALLALLLSACGVATEQELADQELESGTSMLRTHDPRPRGPGEHGRGNNGVGQRGLGTNGLGTNGLGTNGLGTNGLGTNGLSLSAMNSTDFVTWFNQDPALTNTVMRYIVTCAVAEGSSRVWTNPQTGVQHTWPGSLGLTPAWASGSPATETEQQLITACLAAHTNKYGLQVPFSLQGLDATGTPIPVGLLEFVTFASKEACFFGNLFTGEGIFAGNDAFLGISFSSVRACGLESDSDLLDECPPIHHVNPCEELCTPDPLNNYYLSCTYNGKSYRAITTRIRPLDIFVCGDGVCQMSESCGSGLTPGNCRDCGPCP
jgi:hypothetical protein